MADFAIPPVRACLLCGYAGETSVCLNDHAVCGRCHRAFWWGQLMGGGGAAKHPSRLVPATHHELRCLVVGCREPFVNPADVEPGPGKARLARVAEGSEEFAEATAHFTATLAGATVERVFRAHNRTLADTFEMCRARLSREMKDTTEKAMFHGTDRAAAGSIIRSGFDIRYSGTHGEALGPGVYFAERASYSHHFAVEDHGGNLCMIVARVLPGRVPGAGSRAAKRGRQGPGYYDSSVGRNILAVRREQQALPVYVIYYHM
jgi:hypothetical protein